MNVSNLIAGGLPLLFLWLSLAAAFVRMAKRKGVNPTLALAGAFPAWALFFGIWLAVRPNKAEPAGEEEERAETE